MDKTRTSPVIAIVDDEESVRKAMQRLLRSAGWAVETFPSGAKFLEALSTHAIACAVLDLHMAGMSGFEVQEHLMRAGKWLPIIVMTGQDSAEARARAVAGGASAYLLKPLEASVLLEAIAAAIVTKKVGRF